MRLVDKNTGKKIIIRGNKFIDINGSKRTVLFMTKIMHSRTDQATGETMYFPYLEVICESKRDGTPMEKEWWEEEIFLKNNPKIEILED